MTRPSLLRMVFRGALRRCPWCGGRGACLTGWFTKQGHCRSCGLQWRRGDVGFELGAASVASAITFGTLLLVLGAMLAVTWPEIQTVPLFVVLGIIAVVLPPLSYGSAYLIWQAIDIVMRPPDPAEFEIVALLDSDPVDNDVP